MNIKNQITGNLIDINCNSRWF